MCQHCCPFMHCHPVEIKRRGGPLTDYGFAKLLEQKVFLAYWSLAIQPPQAKEQKLEQGSLSGSTLWRIFRLSSLHSGVTQTCTNSSQLLVVRIVTKLGDFDNTHRWGKYHCMALLQFTSLDSAASLRTKNNIFSFLVKSSLVKLETSCTVIR